MWLQYRPSTSGCLLCCLAWLLHRLLPAKYVFSHACACTEGRMKHVHLPWVWWSCVTGRKLCNFFRFAVELSGAVGRLYPVGVLSLWMSNIQGCALRLVVSCPAPQCHTCGTTGSLRLSVTDFACLGRTSAQLFCQLIVMSVAECCV
jgi:hypothetical protein